MHLLSPPSRLVALLAETLFFVVFSLALLLPRGALAEELAFSPLLPIAGESVYGADAAFDSEFTLFDASIRGRAPSEVANLENNVPKALNLQPGDTRCYTVEKRTFLDRTHLGEDTKLDDRAGLPDAVDGQPSNRLDTRAPITVYVSANTCLQPRYVGSKTDVPDIPAMSLFIRQSGQGGCPDPLKSKDGLQEIVFDGGAAMVKLNATDDIHIAIHAPPNVNSEFDGWYNFEVAISFDTFYHSYESTNAQLLWLDSDSNSALLVSRNISQSTDDSDRLLKAPLPYNLYVNQADDQWMRGMRNSACGLRINSKIPVTKATSEMQDSLVRTLMTTRGPGGLPKQQFYIMGLNASSRYTGVLVKTTNTTSQKRGEGQIGGGGTVLKSTAFDTVTGTNCKMVTDLEFCDEIQYAVPGNAFKFNASALAKAYDNYARTMYSNFEKVLMQIQCEAGSTSKYSLVKNCNDCKVAYKKWLCTVSMPRCEDIMSTNSRAIIRNIGQNFPNGTKLSDEFLTNIGTDPANNVSRSHFIDATIQPGPYKEILPCEDVCYNVVQSCPAKIKFTCPQPHFPSFASSYGRRDLASAEVSCNFPGEARTRISAGNSVHPGFAVSLVAFVFFYSFLV